MSGVFAAPVFISGGALAAALFPENKQKNAFVIALYFSGGGLGMIISGIILPTLFLIKGNGSWGGSVANHGRN